VDIRASDHDAVIDAPRRLRVGVAVFGRALVILAALTGLFVLIVHDGGLCRRGESATGGLVLVVALAVVGLAILLVLMLRKYRDVARGPALLGWLASLVPAFLLLMAGQGYVQSFASSCPT